MPLPRPLPRIGRPACLATCGLRAFNLAAFNLAALNLAALFLASLVAALLLVPPASAQGPSIEGELTQATQVAGVEEPLAFRFDFTYTCGTPADPEVRINLEVPSGNYFNITFERTRWDYTAADCAASGGALRSGSNGSFRFTRAMPPFRNLEFPVAAWLGSGETVWTQAEDLLVIVPDAHLRIAAVLGAPQNVRIADGRLRQDMEWVVRNHGTGAFVAAVVVESKPDWLEIELAPSVASDGEPASLAMLAHMPAACPGPSALVTLAFDVRSPDSRSRAHEVVRVQGVVPCRPDLATQGTPWAGAPLLLVALAAAARRAREQKC